VRMVSHLLNIDRELAVKVATGLGIEELPPPAEAAMPTRQDLPPSPALSILRNGLQSFEGRKVGALVSDGADGGLLRALEKALEAEGAMLELVAPAVGGIVTSDGTRVAANHNLDGGPSVLFDAVALLTSQDGAAKMARQPVA